MVPRHSERNFLQAVGVLIGKTLDTRHRIGAALDSHLERLDTMKKFALTLLLAATLSPVASFGQIVVRVGPPAPIVERRGPAPGREFVWIDGYHRWDGARYVWVPGRWDRPPHPGAHWVAHRWVHRNGGYVMVEGHWR
jgi:hypothetical protein